MNLSVTLSSDEYSFCVFEGLLEVAYSSLERMREMVPVGASWSLKCFTPGNAHQASLFDRDNELKNKPGHEAEFQLDWHSLNVPKWTLPQVPPLLPELERFGQSRFELLVVADHCLLTLAWDYDHGTLNFVFPDSRNTPI